MKNKHFGIISVLFVSICIFSGCELGGGGGGSNPMNSLVSPGNSTPPSIEGRWGSSDYQRINYGEDSIPDNEDDEWVYHFCDIDGDDYFEMITYGIGVDERSLTHRISYRINYTIAIGKKVSTPVGAWEINLTVDSITLEAWRDDGASYLNSISAFGFTNWEPNTPKDITGRTDSDGEVVESVGSIIYTIFNISDDVLYFGERDDVHDGLSENLRPILLKTYGLPKRELLPAK